MSISAIISGKADDGTRLLELFLQDYTKLFKAKVNPNCPKCLKNYHTKYKLKLHDMENECDYRLKKMFSGVPLKFGSNIFLTNKSLTNELAEEYIKIRKAKKPSFKASDVFDKYPAESIEVKEPVTVTPKKPRKKRKPRKKSE